MGQFKIGAIYWHGDKILQFFGQSQKAAEGVLINALLFHGVAIDGPCITIRKFQKERLGIDKLIEYDSLTQTMADFLQACVVSRLNVVISGGTGSGKTTIFDALSKMIDEGVDHIVLTKKAALVYFGEEYPIDKTLEILLNNCLS